MAGKLTATEVLTGVVDLADIVNINCLIDFENAVNRMPPEK